MCRKPGAVARRTGPAGSPPAKAPSTAPASAETDALRYYDAGCRHYVENAIMNLLRGQDATCPHCWETINLTLDLSVPEQSYVEDCPVCCKPMLVSYTAVDGEVAQFSVESAE